MKMKEYMKPEMDTMLVDEENIVATSTNPQFKPDSDTEDMDSKSRSDYKHDSLGWDF